MLKASDKNLVNVEDQQSYDWMNPLLTDLYQLTMSYAEWKAGRHMTPCVFEMYFRKCPFKGNFAVFGGLDEVVRFLERFKFQSEHIEHLKSILPHAEPGFFEWLATLDCSQI